MTTSTKWLLFIPFFLGCGVSVRYTGKSYPPTHNVELYSSLKEVKKSYTVMGNTEQKAYGFTKFDKIKKKIIAEAKKRGADAVIFSVTDVHDNNASENIVLSNRDIQTDPSDNSTPPAINNTNEKSVKYLSAEFLRYK